ncbi:MAG TPA: DNA methyltransferase [Coleofasciculaceae cyanobacterium]
MRPVVMEPLREQWDLVQGEVKQILGDVEVEPTAAQKKKAVAALESFLTELRTERILDPACGSGNFLYVTLDLIKQLESEVLRRLEDVTGQAQLRLDIDQVNPSQFLGIELNPRAAAIADLVIWIGYLQWHFRRFGDIPPVEPVLREYKNIECRDAVLAYDGKELDIDAKTGEVRTRWGGRMMKHPVTGEDVPDPSDRLPIYRYINPRAAEWQEADYVVSNPPFIGNYRMRDLLGDGYAETLRTIYGNVPDTADYVLYWWHKAAELVHSHQLNRFGFITTNSIWRVFQRKIIDFHLTTSNPLQLFFAIPDHPWVDNGAAVMIAMTGSELSNSKTQTVPKLGTLVSEGDGETPEERADHVEISWRNVGRIFSNLRASIDVTGAKLLRSNDLICYRGVKLHGKGFCVTSEEAKNIEPDVIYQYSNGRDLLHSSRNVLVIDLFSLSERDVFEKYPKAYQWIYEHVKPERDQNNRSTYRDNWWIFGEPRSVFRPTLKSLSKYIVTVETAKHRVFFFLDCNVVPDNSLVTISLDDPYFLGILSSGVHGLWASSTGGTLEDRPVYTKTYCFDRFPFPTPTPDRQQKIRELGDRLDSHRKRVQAQHPEVTITAMYNLLEKIRAGEELTEKDREFNNKALVSTLKQIHDELDAAVFEAYGWQDLLDPPQPPLKRGEKIEGSASPFLRGAGGDQCRT